LLLFFRNFQIGAFDDGIAVKFFAMFIGVTEV
jgi:hypothetical protein